MEAEQTIFLEFEDRPTEQLVIAPDCTGRDLCALIASHLLNGQSADDLVLIRKSDDMLLDRDQTMAMQAVADDEKLLVLVSRRQPLSGRFLARLREIEMGDTYPIEWQPAVIGRPGHIRDKELLAVNLEWLPDGLTISRQHAFIHERNGQFFIRHVAGNNNLTTVNGHPVAQNESHALRDGDAITLGPRHITLSFLLDLPQGA